MKNQEETINGAQGLEREAAKLDNEANKLEHQAEEIQNEARKLEHEAEELKEEAEKLEHESHEHEHKHHDMLKITINGTDYEIQRGRHTVLELKTLAHIATADQLNQSSGENSSLFQMMVLLILMVVKYSQVMSQAVVLLGDSDG